LITITAARAVTDDGVVGPVAIDIEDGYIGAIRAVSGPAVDQTLVPGFVDLQVNGFGAVDVADTDARGLDDLSQVLAAHGTTTWCPTLVSLPAAAYGDRLAHIADAARGDDTIAGAHLEGPFLGGAPGAHEVAAIAAIDADFLAALPSVVRVVTLAPELDGALDAIAALHARRVIVALGHSTASLAQATGAIDAGARLVTHVFNGMGPLHHREPGLLGAALDDERVSVSMIADLVHVHPTAVRLVFRTKPATGVAVVSDAVAVDSSSARRLGFVSGSDGAVRLADGTLAGAGVLLDTALRNLVEVGIDLETAVRAVSTNPAALLGQTDRGRLAPGARADMVALDPDLRVVTTWRRGVAVN